MKIKAEFQSRVGFQTHNYKVEFHSRTGVFQTHDYKLTADSSLAMAVIKKACQEKQIQQNQVPSVKVSERITKRDEATPSSPTLSQSLTFSITRPSRGHNFQRCLECTKRRLDSMKRREKMSKLSTSLSCRKLQSRIHHRQQAHNPEEKGDELKV
ncbi:hypothetical protein HAX54_041995 [Datura stramonium]|uniref:Uncharacterized protein n=1 Tax=Datura stramonium TaxID=4076 RepID=A0ABS8VY99_DATST|nr:hypothetical protein [Datura stramonium]